jgi:hypothetical protein
MRSCLAVCLLVLLAGCDQSPIVWREPAVVPDPPAASHLVVDTAGRAQFAPDSIRVTTVPTAPGLCLSSVQTVLATSHVYAVWWSVRPDSSAVLYSASSADSGKTWGKAAAVDTTDISSRGCSRPPPSLTSVGDEMYVAYSMTAPEGTGVFFAHTMSSMLHSPVAVIYGDRLVAAAIAAEGDTVAVAYEEPNGKREQIELALSSTQGHIFEQHTTATREVDVAMSPEVALAGRTIAVSWIAQRFDAGASGRIVRIGRITW